MCWLGRVLAWMVHIRECSTIGFLVFFAPAQGFLLITDKYLSAADLFIPGSGVLGQHVQAHCNVLDGFYQPGHCGYIWGDKQGCVCVGMQCTALLHRVQCIAYPHTHSLVYPPIYILVFFCPCQFWDTFSEHLKWHNLILKLFATMQGV